MVYNGINGVAVQDLIGMVVACWTIPAISILRRDPCAILVDQVLELAA